MTRSHFLLVALLVAIIGWLPTHLFWCLLISTFVSSCIFSFHFGRRVRNEEILEGFGQLGRVRAMVRRSETELNYMQECAESIRLSIRNLNQHVAATESETETESAK